MNNIYSLVWSKVRGTWVVASELARHCGKSKNSKVGAPRRGKAVQASVLAVALAGVWGSAAVAQTQTHEPVNHKEGDHVYNNEHFIGSNYIDYFEWVVKAENEGTTVELNGGTVEAKGHKARGVGATEGSTITLNGVEVRTETVESSDWGNHGVQAHGSGSHVDIVGGSITTNGEYSNGIQAGANGFVSGTDVKINVDGNDSHTFGVEAGGGGNIDLTGGSITVDGEGAAGVRSYGSVVDSPSRVVLNDTDIVATGNGTVGLLAGDFDSNTKGTITFSDGEITTAGDSAHAAVALAGSELTIENADLTTSGLGSSAVLLNGAKATLTDVNVVSNSSANSDKQWAVKAESGSTLIMDGGSVSTVGKNMRGISASSGSSATITGVTVTTEGDSGHGVQSFGSDTEVALNDSTINTSGVYALGAHAQDGGLLTGSNNTITTTGNASMGVEVDRGGQINLSGGSITTSGVGAAGARALSGEQDGATPGSIKLDGVTVATSGEDAIGLMAGDEDGNNGPKSAGDIAFKNGSVTTTGDSAHAARAIEGSELTIENANLTTTGSGASGVLLDSGAKAALSNVAINTTSTTGSRLFAVSANRAGTELTMDGGTVSAKGKDVRGLRAYNGAKADINDVVVTTVGDNAHGLQSWEADSHINLSNSTIATNGVYALGAHAQEGGLLTGSNNTITTTGDASMGVEVDRGGQIDLSGGSITTRGDGAAGARSHSGKEEPTRKGSIKLDGVTVATSGKNAIGLMAGDEDGAGGTITAGDIGFSNASVTTTGDNAHAARAIAGSELTIDNATLRSSGKNAHGIMASDSDTTVSMTGGSITATGANSSGLYVQDGADVTLDGVTVASKGASIQSTLTNSDNQSITISNGSTLTENNGILWDVSRNAAADGTATLTVDNGAVVWGNVIENNGATMDPSKTVMDVGSDAFWVGVVVGQNDTRVADGKSQQFNADPIQQLVTGTGSSATFANGANIANSVSAGMGSTTSFNGDTDIGGDVHGLPASQLAFNGATNIGGAVNGVNGAQFGFNGPSTHIGGNVNLIGDDTHLSGGTIDAPIQIDGDATVDSGAVLGGNVNVAGALRGDGGVLSPGNSIGHQTYGTSAGFSGDYLAEINAAGKSDLITISSGDFDLTGINLYVAQENGNGGYKINHDYTIVETGDAIGISSVANNRFANDGELTGSLAQSLVKLDPVNYGDDNVKIRVSLDDDKVDDARNGLSSNQNATLDGVLSVLGRNAAADAAVTSADYKNALNQLSGEIHGSTQTALMNSSHLLVNTLSDRMRANQGALTAQGSTSATTAAYPLWAQVVGNWNTLKGDSNTAKVRTDTGGIFIGGDAEVGNGWRVGGAAGFTDGRIKVNARDSKSDVKSYTAAIYGGNSWEMDNGSLNFLAGVGYTRHDIDTRRHVTVGGAQTLKAGYKGNTTQLFTELGYAVPVGEASTVEPYLGLAWIGQRTKSFSESGGAAALKGKSQRDDVTAFTMGLRGETVFDMGDSQGKLMAGAGWRHASGDVDAARRVAFRDGNGDYFKIAGAPIAKNAAVLDLGAEMQIGKNSALGLSYAGQFGSGQKDNVGSLYLRVRFD